MNDLQRAHLRERDGIGLVPTIGMHALIALSLVARVDCAAAYTGPQPWTVMMLDSTAHAERMSPADLDSWLDANSCEVTSLDFDAPLDDLEPLKAMLAGVRVVMLGEQSHSDGASFAAKARLVKFLHAEMGFDVLVFESGLYECERANNRLRYSRDAIGAMDDSIFGIWRVDEVRPLFEYMQQCANDERPLLLAGFDCRASGAGHWRMYDEVIAFIRTVATISEEDVEFIHALRDARQQSPYAPDERERAKWISAWQRLLDSLREHREDLIDMHGERKTLFFDRVLQNEAAGEQMEFEKLGDESMTRSYNTRDAQMASNLIWLADEWHAGRKIICWGATSHFIHNRTLVRDGETQIYEHMKMMGEPVRQHFGSECYVVGFLAHHGRAGQPWRASWELPPAPHGSLQEILHDVGRPQLFLNLRAGGAFVEPMPASMMGYGTLNAPWPQIMDGIMFIDEMYPSTRLKRGK